MKRTLLRSMNKCKAGQRAFYATMSLGLVVCALMYYDAHCQYEIPSSTRSAIERDLYPLLDGFGSDPDRWVRLPEVLQGIPVHVRMVKEGHNIDWLIRGTGERLLRINMPDRGISFIYEQSSGWSTDVW